MNMRVNMRDFEGAFISQNGLKSARQIIVENQGVISGQSKVYPGVQKIWPKLVSLLSKIVIKVMCINKLIYVYIYNI